MKIVISRYLSNFPFPLFNLSLFCFIIVFEIPEDFHNPEFSRRNLTLKLVQVESIQDKKKLNLRILKKLKLLRERDIIRFLN